MAKIMVIDDDSVSLAICEAILGEEYEVAPMKSSVQAVGYLKSTSQPDVILLDMVMPEKTGMQVLKELKKNDKFADIPVIFLTGTDTEQFEIEGIKNGAADFIRKPVASELLQLKIKLQLHFLALRKENRMLKEKLNKIKAIL